MIAPSGATTAQSVNVPPMSTPTKKSFIALVVSVATAALLDHATAPTRQRVPTVRSDDSIN